MKKAILAVVLCSISIASVKADVITLPLPELIGPVGRHPNWDVVSFDLGVTFSSIQSVQVQYSGSISPGLAQGDGAECPVYPQVSVPGRIQVFMDHPASGSCITNIGPYNGSFSVIQDLECTYDANWDILLDGQEELITHVTSDFGSICQYIIVSPTATISDASLIVEGTVICDYVLTGDLDDNCRVDLQDVALLAANWLIDCIDDPTNPACVTP
jgi:hypothetical protein